MDHPIHKVKLKHLETILSEKPDYASLMMDIFGYNNSYLHKKFLFVRHFKKAFAMVQFLQTMKPDEIPLDPNCKIKFPAHVDHISFRAMMELQGLSTQGHRPVNELILDTITIVCYGESTELDYDSNSSSFKRFKQRVNDQPLIYMMGLHNHISNQLIASQKAWQERFDSVDVDDPDYHQAGGERMAQFNVINTVKSICADFNVSYDKAWQMPYALTQTNSYAKASYAYTQSNMQKLKEIKMEAKRKEKK